MRPQGNCQTRGFATATAICLIALVGMVAVGLSAFLVQDARRTSRLAVEAQLQQMLLASTAAMPQYLNQWDGRQELRQTLAFPDELNRQGGTITLDILPAPAASQNTAIVRLTASLQARHAAQRLAYTRAGQRWTLEQASLQQ